MTVRAGREFLAIPGPTTMPDEVLRAMHRPALDIYSDQMVEMTHSLLGDLYYTDGEVWVLRLVTACRKRTGPTTVIASPPATEIKDQIWQAVANTLRN